MDLVDDSYTEVQILEENQVSESQTEKIEDQTEQIVSDDFLSLNENNSSKENKKRTFGKRKNKNN